ncbi:DUF4430 domain-containing protein [Limosilactobacillus reuteri]|jgi:hypothetical protein|uniref:Transcobalamin-like C-terminal domain-containing protein n=3 Tax=Limosilactobacillus reuteri TaxID=1598 RepID=A5VM59_LIMRD|nr:DUF4430 domain-containing protein [Limosilactobacillus reuteri]AAX14545.1 hypothetical protein [Limosilactobacillus reuteri]ABQ83933.1 hypothetical protein Lreu_1694 [Limosilactobacillus reuteri subsp. reuteri]AKP01904.1 hypothetical protein LRIRT_1679 [Limosilactobacillus reuteri]EEI09285.1 hypothetical protein HMPREF0535_0978 [Limosilactobacillus reuteri MM2-3]EGC14546.1 hypothetical protein HMPREF0536_11683 [Limosilactobacillus reuteri MM4-1A]
MKKFKVLSSILAMFLAFFMLTGYTNKDQKGNNNTIKVTYTLKQGKKTVATRNTTLKKNDKVITGLKKNWKVEEAKGFITSIDGRKENQKKSIYWTYTVNGKKVNKLANQQTLKNNDKVQFTLDKAE